tara:strand:+ start:3675 stop:3926 length:252 start_codon:yes stop_codon:yes gene_type:complete
MPQQGRRKNPQKVEEFTKDLISKLIKRREELNISQEKLNEKIGVADNLVAKWECGMRLPSGFLLYCWTQALNLKIELKENNCG